MKVPDDAEIHIWAVEIEDNINFAEKMTPALEEGYEEYCSEILAEIKELLS